MLRHKPEMLRHKPEMFRRKPEIQKSDSLTYLDSLTEVLGRHFPHIRVIRRHLQQILNAHRLNTRWR